VILPACTGDVPGAQIKADADKEEEACRAHADCASDVCDVYLTTHSGPGRCIPEPEVLYVDGRGVHGSLCDGAGDGSRSDPFCSIRDAVAAADHARSAIRVSPGTYFPFSVRDKRLAIYGPAGEGGVVDVTEEDISGSTVSGPADVILDGLSLGRHSRFGVRCDGGAARPKVHIRRSEVLSDIGVALEATGCDLLLDRSRVSGLYGAMVLEDTRFVMTSNVISGVSERTAIRFEASDGRFLLNTVTRNGDPSLAHPGAIDCGATPVVLEDSIIAGNLLGPGGSQLTGSCVLDGVVVGSADVVTSPGAIRLDPELDDYRLPRTAANLGCCIDRAADHPDVPADIDGTPRPQGPAYDIGAYEAPL
jgi:hypothetical protein